VLARIRTNGNCNNASLERLHSASGLGINGMLSPSDAFDLEVASELNVPEHCFIAFVNNVSRRGEFSFSGP